MTRMMMPDMETDAWFSRVNDTICYYDFRAHAICPQCNSGEIYAPMQTCAPPFINQCLRCNHTAEVSEFKI